jgi:hypothetical protein
LIHKKNSCNCDSDTEQLSNQGNADIPAKHAIEQQVNRPQEWRENQVMWMVVISQAVLGGNQVTDAVEGELECPREKIKSTGQQKERAKDCLFPKVSFAHKRHDILNNACCLKTCCPARILARSPCAINNTPAVG